MKQEIGKTVEYWKIYRQVLNLYIYLGIRRAILSVPLNTDLTWIQLKSLQGALRLTKKQRDFSIFLPLNRQL